MSNEKINKKLDLEFFLKEMCSLYKNKFKESISRNYMFHFCINDLKFFKDENKRKFFCDCYSKLSFKFKKKYGKLVGYNDLKYLYDSFLLPYDDMIYYNNELDKEYVDLDSLMNHVSLKYNVDYELLSNRLNDTNNINKHVLKLKK